MTESQLSSDVKKLAESLGPLPEPVVHPPLIVIAGLPGTGKSYFSRRLAERLSLVTLESDILRRVLFSQPTYTAPESARLFQTTHRLIEELLKKGIPVLLDATNLSEHFREYLYRIADRTGARLILVRMKAPPEVVKERLEARVTGKRDTSDADWSVYQRMKGEVEEIRRRHYVVNTSKDITPVLDKIIREAERSQ
ncbi:MAG: ATP-binding protein [Chloroflexota bacterium]